MTVSTTKVVKTGLEIPVKPVPDRVLTEEEYRKRIDRIRKDREQSEAIQRMVDSSYTKPRTKPLPRVAQPVPRRPAVRSVQPRPVPMRGLLHPEPTPPKGRSLFDYEPPPSGRLKR